MKLTIGAMALALLVILGSLVSLSAQAPAQQQKRATSQTISSSAAAAQGEIPELRVAVFIIPPQAMEKNGSLTGFNIDLWNAIATRLKVKSSFQIAPDSRALEEALRSKTADLSLPAFITLERDAEFDFSYPTLEAGLQVMVRGTGATQGAASRLAPVLDMLRLLFSRTTIEWLVVGLLLVLIPAHVIWFLERRQEGGIISNRNYFPGIFEAFYWGLATLAAQVEIMPRQWIARSLAILWMFASVVFIASYTAQLTTTLTVEQIRGAIEGPGDLPGKQVAALPGSIAASYLRQQNAQVQELPVDQIFTALLNNKVDAVVAPTPLLFYYAAHEGKGRVKTVGHEFDRRPIAIMLQLNSPWRKKIDGALVALRENGTYGQIYDKWFGGS